jgi:hypothetical protein
MHRHLGMQGLGQQARRRAALRVCTSATPVSSQDDSNPKTSQDMRAIIPAWRQV